MTSDKKIIAICVATFKRPELLKNCLNYITRLSIPQQYTLIVIIVDNDAARTGESSFNEIKTSINFDLQYFVETERGISSARNRLLKEALNNNADFIGFFDDDEFPDRGWLINIIATLNKYNADVATGPVRPVHDLKPTNKANLNNKLNTGEKPRNVAANNVLFKSKLVSESDLWFNLKYSFIGGEDFDFFDRSSNKGHVHVWAADAIMYEYIPEERRTNKYLFYRHFTGAINNVVYYKSKNNSLIAWPHFLIKSIGKLLGALIEALLFLFTFKQKRAEKVIIKLASSIGYICGLLNIIVERYRY
jgi:GT2 family glycosyltransferase